MPCRQFDDVHRRRGCARPGIPARQTHFFDKAFAVSALTTLSVIAVPLLYVMLLNSPVMMMGLADLGCANFTAVGAVREIEGGAEVYGMQKMEWL
ncbi:MAG: hypothetical protein R3D67_03330 [Hyphomicrobiaceae bacterium]